MTLKELWIPRVGAPFLRQPQDGLGATESRLEAAHTCAFSSSYILTIFGTGV